MTTLDEQMAAIDRLTGSEELPICVDGWHCTDNVGYDVDMAYLVACANAAPDLCAEVRRLRDELRRVQLEESLLSRVVSAAAEFVREIDPENPEENNPSTIIRVIDEWHKTKPWWTEDHQLNWKMGRDGDDQ